MTAAAGRRCGQSALIVSRQASEARPSERGDQRRQRRHQRQDAAPIVTPAQADQHGLDGIGRDQREEERVGAKPLLVAP
ncbi:hypothetical protein ASG54_02405 [Aureimonas sp. Leaf460]|nr:hypothetical protein ASG54_02405 [Aureimonas sp. Leaf460]